MSIFFRLCTTILFLSVGSWACAEDAAVQLMALLKPINGLSANFEQQSSDKSGKPLQQQSGHFVVKKSGEFAWYVNPPYEQHIISDGKIINIYDPDLEQLTIKPLDPKAQMIPLLLFSESGQQVIAQYIVSQTEAGSHPVFELQPKQNGSLFDRLTIAFSSRQSTFLPVQLDITDSLKQTTQVRFDKVLLNPSVDSKIFLFSAPEGVDVIDERH